ncbi:hypothetical protein O9992_24670 [Vibrio lentus]|nr:hypothetical protein [Vibrio lentus]
MLSSQHTISQELVEAIKQVAQHTHVVIVTDYAIMSRQTLATISLVYRLQ